MTGRSIFTGQRVAGAKRLPDHKHGRMSMAPYRVFLRVESLEAGRNSPPDFAYADESMRPSGAFHRERLSRVSLSNGGPFTLAPKGKRKDKYTSKHNSE